MRNITSTNTNNSNLDRIKNQMDSTIDSFFSSGFSIADFIESQNEGIFSFISRHLDDRDGQDVGYIKDIMLLNHLQSEFIAKLYFNWESLRSLSNNQTQINE